MSEQSAENIRQFLDECTLSGLDESEAVAAADLYGMYMIWCENAGRDTASVQHFYAVVREAGVPEVMRRSERVYEGMLPTGPISIQYIMETNKAPGPNTSPFPFNG